MGIHKFIFVMLASEKFLLKTILRDEAKALIRMIHSYHLHLHHNPSSLLARYLSLLKIGSGAHSTYIVVQANVMDPQCVAVAGAKPMLYDLKGRVCKAGKWLQNEGQDIVHKDKDLNHHFELEAHQLQMLQRQLLVDTAFLREHDLMDYSLFIAVIPKPPTHPHPHPPPRSMFNADYGGILVEGTTPQVLYLGIIDMLTDYNPKKKVANFCKNFIWTNAELSTVPAAYYANRFLMYMDVIFIERGQPPTAAPYLVKAPHNLAPPPQTSPPHQTYPFYTPVPGLMQEQTFQSIHSRSW
eukprot:GGOE01020132.1.p1 GENE.GGOE01020132.1~~GGOE01020132.1.p1  ORF type:complete len:297 (+),score=22.85 GGOE01020132.1:103-993(+)